MNMRNTLVFLLISFSIFQAFGQDATNFTQFYINPYTINPSYAGIDGRAAVFLAYRKQWAGIDGGPSISNFSFHAPLEKGVNAGLSVTNDKRGIVNNTALVTSFAYQLTLDRDKFIRFGASIGGAWNTIDLDQINGTTDPVLANALSSNFSLQGNVGLSFHLKEFHLGASMPGLFAPSIVSEDGFTVSELRPFQSIIALASNRFYFARDKHVFEPYVVYRLNSNLPSQFEVAGVLHLNHTLWLGGSYKQDFGISAVGGIKVNNSLAVGGSYTFKNTGINELGAPTFEINLSLLPGKKKRDAEVYSFVSTVKEKRGRTKSRSQLLAEKRKKKALEDKKKLELAKQEAKEKQELARKEAEEKKRLAEKEAAAVVVVTPEVIESTEPQHDAGARQKRQQVMTIIIPYDTTNTQETAAINRLKEFEKNPRQLAAVEEHTLQSDRHDFGKIGNHPKELPVGNYVIAAAFKTEANVKSYSDGLNKLGFTGNYGYSSEKGVWFAYISKSDDINQTENEHEEFRKLRLFLQAWIVTVYE